MLAAAILALGMSGCIEEEEFYSYKDMNPTGGDIVNSADEAWVTCDKKLFDSPEGYCLGFMFLERVPGTSYNYNEYYLYNAFQLIFGNDDIGWYVAESEDAIWSQGGGGEDPPVVHIVFSSNNPSDYGTNEPDKYSSKAASGEGEFEFAFSISGDTMELYRYNKNAAVETVVFTRKSGITISTGYSTGFYKSRRGADLLKSILSRF
jgi:hypothetical protein